MKIIVRPFNASTDSGLIYSTMPKGIYYAAHNPSEMEKSNFFTDIYTYLKEMIPHANIFIACTKEEDEFDLNPSVILGYLITIGDTLEWIYIKEIYRKQGIAKMLLKNRKIAHVNESNLTKIGYQILKNHESLFKEEKEEPIHESNTPNAP